SVWITFITFSILPNEPNFLTVFASRCDRNPYVFAVYGKCLLMGGIGLLFSQYQGSMIVITPEFCLPPTTVSATKHLFEEVRELTCIIISRVIEIKTFKRIS